MGKLMMTALRVFGAATVGAAAAAGYAIASGLAFNALSRGLEIGAIPLLLAAFVFVGLLAGTVAGLLCRERPYLAAILAAFLIFVFATGVNDLKEQLTPAMTRDGRREFWASIEGLLFGGFPFGVPFALWGALLASVNPGRLDAPRAVSYPFAGFIGFGAVAPVAVHWFPWQMGLPLAAVASLSFIVWIVRRNRHTAQAGTTEGIS
jgi:hypothetical protein